MPGTRPATPTHATRWVADRLGISTATLRTWHHRYGLAPTARTPGGHRRYSGADLGRLEAMHQLIRSGVPAAEAARLSHADRPATSVRRPAGRPRGSGVDPGSARRQRRDLHRAALELNGTLIDRLIAEALRAHGVVATWTDLLVPVLQELGECFADSVGCIAAEHVLTQRISAALSGVVARRARSCTGSPVLLAAVEKEPHLLPLQALSAALAENRRTSLLLGSVPPEALDAAIGTVQPSVVFVWAWREPSRRAALPAGGASRPTAPRLVLGGPGWRRRRPADDVVHAETLRGAVDALRADTQQPGPPARRSR